MTEGTTRASTASAEGAQVPALRVTQVGDYSVSNWGDQLYPGATAHLFAGAGIRTSTSYFAPLYGKTPAGEEIRPFTEAPNSAADLVVVGGGDLIRFDSRTVALDHMSVPHEVRHRRLTRLRARLYARRHFLEGPGAWVPEAGWVPGAPAALLSVGVHTIPARARAALNRYSAAWVRTESGAQRFIEAGMPEDQIILGPDMIFALPDLEDPDAARERGLSIFSRRLGVDGPVALFHATTFHGWPQEKIEAALRTIKNEPVAVLSLGAYSGEDRVLAAAAKRTGAHALIGLSAPEITSALAAAGAVFTTSMHAAIVGASFGTPVLVPGVKKTGEAFAVCPQPPKLKGVADSDIAAEMSAAFGTHLDHDPRPNADAAKASFIRTLERTGAI